MTNLERAVAILARHREARQWSDEAVAAALLAEFGLVDAAAVAEPEPVVVEPPAEPEHVEPEHVEADHHSE